MKQPPLYPILTKEPDVESYTLESKNDKGYTLESHNVFI